MECLDRKAGPKAIAICVVVVAEVPLQGRKVEADGERDLSVIRCATLQLPIPTRIARDARDKKGAGLLGVAERPQETRAAAALEKAQRSLRRC
jgi:hypothetical protein